MIKSTLTAIALISLSTCQTQAEQSRIEWLPYDHYKAEPSHLQLQDTDNPTAVAEVEFKNTRVHGEDGDFTLTFEGLSVRVFMEFNCVAMEDECLTVIAPDGYIAEPMELSVPENETAYVLIIPYLGF